MGAWQLPLFYLDRKIFLLNFATAKKNEFMKHTDDTRVMRDYTEGSPKK